MKAINKAAAVSEGYALEMVEIFRKRIERTAHLKAAYEASARQEAKLLRRLERKGITPWIADGELSGLRTDEDYFPFYVRDISGTGNEYFLNRYTDIENEDLSGVEVSDELKAIIKRVAVARQQNLRAAEVDTKASCMEHFQCDGNCEGCDIGL
jgi:hypothetical protein